MNAPTRDKAPWFGATLPSPPWPALFGRIPRDIPVAAVVAAVQIAGTLAAMHNQQDRAGLRDPDILAYLLIGVGPVLLLARSRYPVQVLAASLLPPILYTLRDYPPGPIFLSLIVALFTAMTAGHRAVSYASLAVGYLTMGWIGPWLRDDELPDAAWAGGVAAWLLVLATFSEVVRTRRAYRAAERRRAAEEQAAREEAERARFEAERARAGEERLRIARELHDVLAHHISMMNVQASVGLELMDGNPEQARTALTAVKQASREALGELRGVLAILKGDGESAPRTPTAGLADLDDLVARASTAHLAVRLECEEAVLRLPGPVGPAAYRIVQEALTNAVRHSGASMVTVRLSLDRMPPAATAPTADADTDTDTDTATDTAEALRVVVADDGRGFAASPSPGSGQGLRNMRERAAALGGRLDSGPRPAGGYEVVALLPLTGQDGDPAEHASERDSA
ncbi:sensor histidine kinase [Yinghuangia soli]|uniref:histidine kinase n=1 Tax=Yinghuangia soli TaxID=2908204 RepID=A0AA41Q1R7_9ACTN|nr:sensor histidine kinase [Yinghuangia soli]MCF2529597.1 sensor histidine kinase [Yinghuangia soli]